MKIGLIILFSVMVVAVGAYFLLVPRDILISLKRSGGGAVTFSRTGVSFEAAPDHYATNGFAHIGPYVSRLVVPTNRFKLLSAGSLAA
jgi:hypothetical protein